MKKIFPQVRWSFCVLVAIAGHLGEPLSPAPITTPSPSSPRVYRCGMLAPIRTLEEKTHFVAAVRCCMRGSLLLLLLLLLLLWLAIGIGCALFVGRSAVCVWVVCVIHIRALSTAVKHRYITSWALFVLGLNRKLNSKNESSQNSSGCGFWEQHPNEARTFPVVLEMFSFWKEKRFRKLSDNQ